jgi:hypothetical protein
MCRGINVPLVMNLLLEEHHIKKTNMLSVFEAN